MTKEPLDITLNDTVDFLTCLTCKFVANFWPVLLLGATVGVILHVQESRTR